jgi:hypothetical protein
MAALCVAAWRLGKEREMPIIDNRINATLNTQLSTLNFEFQG